MSSPYVNDEIIVQQLRHVLSKLNLSDTDPVVAEKCSHLLSHATKIPVTHYEKPIESYIDHTVLKPNATRKDIEQLCREATENHFYAVCVNLCRLEQCIQLLAQTTTKVAVVVGFPLGATSTHIKVEETKEAIEKGANEIDMVINIGKLLDDEYQYVFHEISALVQECNKHNVLLKCILETSLLPSDIVLVDACLLCLLAGAHFVKTCTGFMGGGATLEHVQLMRRVVGYNSGVQVKASGGVRSYSDAIRLIREGHIDRIGTSSGVSIKSGQVQSQSTAQQPDSY